MHGALVGLTLPHQAPPNNSALQPGGVRGGSTPPSSTHGVSRDSRAALRKRSLGGAHIGVGATFGATCVTTLGSPSMLQYSDSSLQ